MKNYYIYETPNGKIKRQAIKLNDIYPESYAMDKIPDDCDIFAKIVTSENTPTLYKKSSWQKHDFHSDWTEKGKREWQNVQNAYKAKYRQLITKQEVNLLDKII